MAKNSPKQKKSLFFFLYSSLWIALGTFLAAFSLEIFLIPNQIIDGGIVGASMICSTLFGAHLLPFFLLLFNLPFLWIAYRNIGQRFVIQMFTAICFFAGWLTLLSKWTLFHFEGDMLEVIVIGGLLLGVGIGLIIRVGGCLDGTEILAILVNKKKGYTVGQVVLFLNVFIFATAGIIFNDWHPPIYSFMTFIVAIQLMDKVIVGMEETKSVMIMSPRSKEIKEAIIHELGLGLTIMYGRGGFSGEDIEILYVITERLQLNALKDVVHREDPCAFLAVESLHEISNGRQHDMEAAGTTKGRKKRRKKPLIPRVKH